MPFSPQRRSWIHYYHLPKACIYMEMLVCRFENSIIIFPMKKIVIHIAGCHHHLPFQEQGRPCSWTCFTPVWWPLVKRESTSIPSCWTFTKVSIMPLTVIGSFLFYPLYFFFSVLSRCASRNCLPLCVQVKPLLYSLLLSVPGLSMQVFLNTCLTFVYCLQGSTRGNKAFRNERWGNCSPMTPYRRLPWR